MPSEPDRKKMFQDAAGKMDRPGVWILAEQSSRRVLRVSFELLTRGRELADKLNTALTAVIFGYEIPSGELQEMIEGGADQVLCVESPELEHFLPEPYGACFAHLIREHKPYIVIAAATSMGRTLMPYTAIKVKTGLTADCTRLDIEEGTGLLLQTRPAIGGNIMATITTPNHRPQMATVRPRSARPAVRQPGRQGQIMRRPPPPGCLASRIKRVAFIPSPAQQGLSEAEIVVAVGRGIKKAENLPVVQPLVEALHAALGATRDVVDRGWLPYPYQIGLSGKTITPKLYVGVGVSGSIQHLAGMQTADTIVAINNDPDAQIFRVADFGIVGDLFAVIPVLAQRMKETKEGK
jgi:electron transfer flavoprotein alpha subunit